jgi:hypothetical protein
MTRSTALASQQAWQILAMLISEGKVRERDARLALARYRKRVDQLRNELRVLEGGNAPFPDRSGRNVGSAA